MDNTAAGSFTNISEKPVIALAWSNTQNSYTFQSIMATVAAMGAEVKITDMARSYDLEYDENGRLKSGVDEQGYLSMDAANIIKKTTWHNSNAEEVMKDFHCIIFPGGWDISPTLYGLEEWHGVVEDGRFSAERDVSDYILLSYCLEKDIPILAVCRGMQMLSLVSGANLIQDIPEWLEEQGIDDTCDHRNLQAMVFSAHPVDVLSKDSLLYRVTGKSSLVDEPSWHHQTVQYMDDAKLTICGLCSKSGCPLIEAVEREDQSFCLGVQFHPEVTIRKVCEGSGSEVDVRNYDQDISYFEALKNAGLEHKRVHK